MIKSAVSIITPSYNTKAFIKATFDSVISQTYSNWEWIIVDDQSTDDSFDYVKELAKNEKRITVLQTPKNSGTAVARNIGLKNAKGRYITFLDSDDILDPNYLENQLEKMKNNGPIISAGYRRKTENSCTNFLVPEVNTYISILKGNPLSCLTTMYDREVIGDRLFPEDLMKCEDYVFWLNILKEGYVAKGNPSVLATYILHQGSKSSKKFRLIKYMHYVYHKTQGINWFKSWFCVVRWAFYGKRKYKGVK